MPFKAKYADFTTSEPYACNNGQVERSYVNITCPHCKDNIGKILKDRIGSYKSTFCKAHLSQCKHYDLPTDPTSPSTTLVLHDACRAKEQSLTEQLEAMRNENKQAREAQNSKHEAIMAELRGTSQRLGRWEHGFVSIMQQNFPTLVEPVNEESIPLQMLNREENLKLKYQCENDTRDTELKRLRLEVNSLARERDSERQARATMEEKFKSMLGERDGMIPAWKYKDLLQRFDFEKQMRDATRGKYEAACGQLGVQPWRAPKRPKPAWPPGQTGSVVATAEGAAEGAAPPPDSPRPTPPSNPAIGQKRQRFE